MAYPYQKHIWVTKEIIRREYLQNIEDGIYDEQQERLSVESSLNTAITTESSRAITRENEINNALTAEVTRATTKDAELTDAISDFNDDLIAEKTRAEGVEGTLSTLITNVGNNLQSEISRATTAENAISSDLSVEESRAVAAETAIANNLSAETTRATNAENTLTTNIASETTRAIAAESNLSNSISTETTRATNAESDLRSYIDEKISSTYRPSGSIYFADLPPLSSSRVGNVYDIKDAFTTTNDFAEGAGKYYGAGQNVDIIALDAYIEAEPDGTENPSDEEWYEFDGSTYELSEDTTVDSTKTYYIKREVYKYDVLSGFVDFSNYVEKTDYASTSDAGVIKVDGTTANIDANGVLHAKGESANFCGLKAEWNVLTNDEKDHYDTVDLLDD